MKWHKNLWMGKDLDEKLWKIKWKINHNVGQLNIYLLTIPTNPHNQLEIIHSAMLLFKHYPKKDLYIVGIAKGYEEALSLVCQITEQTLRETHTANIREYILKTENKGGETCQS